MRVETFTFTPLLTVCRSYTTITFIFKSLEFSWISRSLSMYKLRCQWVFVSMNKHSKRQKIDGLTEIKIYANSQHFNLHRIKQNQKTNIASEGFMGREISTEWPQHRRSQFKQYSVGRGDFWSTLRLNAKNKYVCMWIYKQMRMKVLLVWWNSRVNNYTLKRN